MIKKIVLVTACWGSLMATAVVAQNLVMNPSFEVTASCPMGPSQFTLANNWDDLNTNVGGDSCSSPDLYGTCSWVIGGVNSPSGLLGFQSSRTGDHHAGIIAESRPPIISACPPSGGSVDNYREYLGGQLSSPLVAGQSYCVQFYVSLANKSGWGIDKLGIYFYNSGSPIAKDFCNDPTPIQIPLSNPGLLMTSGAAMVDTVNWVLLNWNYTAQGGENRFAIGNFFDKNTMNRAANDCSSQNLQGGMYCYYFIDDVSVTPGTCCITDVANPGICCINDAAFNLVPQTPGGTFSGPGITNGVNGTFDPSVAGAGTHTITYTLPCGSGTINVTVNNCTSLSVCMEPNGDLTVSGGSAPYQWQSQTTTQDCSACLIGCTFPPGCAVNVQSWSTYSSSQTAAPGSLPIQVVDNSGGSALLTTLAGIPSCSVSPCPPVVIATTSQSAVSCNGGANGAATMSASGGNGGPFTYVWTPGGMQGATQSTLSAGTYTVNVTGNGGCTGTTSVTITEPSLLTGTTTATDASCGMQDGSASVTVSGGTAPYSYSWSPSGGSGAATTSVGPGVYTVTVTDANSCIYTTSASVGTVGGPSVSLVSQQDVSCAGTSDGTAAVSATGGATPYSYSWSPSGEMTASAVQLPAGSNTVTVTDANGCSVSLQVTIGSPAAMVISGNVTDENCGASDGSISVSVSGGATPYTYVWTGSPSTGSTASGLPQGSYSVTVTDASGCSAVQSFAVSQTGGIVITAVPASASLLEGESIPLLVSGGISYQWTPAEGLSCTDCPNPIASPSTSTTYMVTGTDANGCTGIVYITISVTQLCGEFFVPTIFSPNDDLLNDVLCAYGDCFTDVTFAIYNRWGEKVFETDNLQQCWDATYKGKPVNAETFVYKFRGKRADGEIVKQSGNIQVVR